MTWDCTISWWDVKRSGNVGNISGSPSGIRSGNSVRNGWEHNLERGLETTVEKSGCNQKSSSCTYYCVGFCLSHNCFYFRLVTCSNWVGLLAWALVEAPKQSGRHYPPSHKVHPGHVSCLRRVCGVRFSVRFQTYDDERLFTKLLNKSPGTRYECDGLDG